MPEIYWEIRETCLTCSKQSTADVGKGSVADIQQGNCRDNLQKTGWIYLPNGAICPECVNNALVEKLKQ